MPLKITPMTKSYRANGKLLLTAEYTILDGAIGLGFQLKKDKYLKLLHVTIKSFIGKALTIV